MRKLSLLLTVLFLFIAGSGALFAQSLTGTVAGQVKDEQGGILPGVSVTLTGKTGAKTVVTDAQGEYRFVGVDPGTYTLTAELSGFRTAQRASLAVRIGGEARADFALGVSGREETIEVVGEAPVVDVTSSATDNNLSQDMLFNLPIRPRNAATQLLDYLPGINDGSAYGGNQDYANGLLIDGVDTRDPEAGSAWTFYSFNIVEEVQVSGLGAPAEFGSFTGAVVNTITKSGGNRFSGLFDAYWTKDSFFSDNITEEIATENPALADPAQIDKQLDLTAQLGGPIVKDKLFFFLSAQRFERKENPTGPRTNLEEYSPRVNGKLTWQPGPNDTVTGMFQYDQYNIIGRAGVSTFLATDELTNREDAPEWVWGFQWRHLFGSRTFTEVKYNGWTGFYDLNPEVNEPGIFDGATGLYSQSQGWYYYADRGRNQLNASISHYAEAFGRHDLKFGVEIERSTVRNRYGYVDDITYYDYSTYYPSKQYYAYSYGYDIEGRNQRESIYAQDSWKPNDRLTVNAGVRLDFVRGYPGDVSANGPNGDAKVYDATSLAPRIGFAFDVSGDSKTVLKGHYGQYYEGVFFDAYSGAVPGISDYVTYAFDPGGEKCGPAGNCFTEVDRSPGLLYEVDDDIKHPRVDEITLGLERAITGDVRFSVTGIWREDKNVQATVYPDARWAPTTVPNELTGGTQPAYTWVNRSASENYGFVTNVDGFQYLDSAGNVLGSARAERKYRALMLVLDKRFSNRWQGRVSYVYAKNEGTMNNSGSNTYGVSRYFESPSVSLVNADGLTSNDRQHELKVFATYQIPKIELSLSGYWRSISGYPYAAYTRYSTRQINFPYSAGREPYLEPRGARRNDMTNVLDLRLEKSFKVGDDDDRISIYADIENVFNASTVLSRITRHPSQAIAGVGDVEFDAPATVVLPRRLTLAARWAF